MEKKPTQEDIYLDWIIVDQESDIDVASLILDNISEEKSRKLLQRAIEKGMPPKTIKKLAPPESHEQLLRKARSNFALIHGPEYALEDAVLQDNLNFCKTLLNNVDDIFFKFEIFLLAARHRKIKTTRFIASSTPNLINHATLHLLYEFITETTKEKSLRSLKLIFKSNLTLDDFQHELIINHGIKESNFYKFKLGTNFFEKRKQIFLKEQKKSAFIINSDLMVNSL